MNSTNYSVRWTGWINCPTTGRYTFETVADDGVRLFLDNSTTPLINAWYEQSADVKRPNSNSVELVQGAHRLRLEYFQGPAPDAQISLRWKVPGYEPTVINGVPELPPLVPAADTPIKTWSVETPLSGGGWITPVGAGNTTGTFDNPFILEENQLLPFDFGQVTDVDRWRQGAIETDTAPGTITYYTQLFNLQNEYPGTFTSPSSRSGSYKSPTLSENQSHRRVSVSVNAYDTDTIGTGETGVRDDANTPRSDFEVIVRQKVWSKFGDIGFHLDDFLFPGVPDGRLISPVDTRNTSPKPAYAAPGGIVTCQVETATDYDSLVYYPDSGRDVVTPIPDANYVWTTTRGTFRVQTGPNTYNFPTSVTGKKVYFVAPPVTNGASTTATVKCTISDPFVVAKPDTGIRTDAPLIRTQQIIVPANTVEVGMLGYSAPALIDGTRPEQFTPKTTVGGTIYPTAFVTVGQGMRVESDFGTVRLEELPDLGFTAAQQHSPETNHIDFYLCFYQAWGWEKFYDPDGNGPQLLDWWKSPEAPQSANSAAGPVKYRYRFTWNSSALTKTPYEFPGQPISTLLGHNGAHLLSYVCSDIDLTKPQLDFTSNYGGSYLDGAHSVGLTVKNMVITGVSTNNGTSDYFKFNPTAAVDSLLKNPTVNFTISDDTDSAGHVYRWRVRVRSTNIEDQTTSVVYEDIATQAGPVVVPINQARLAADNPPTTTGISDWGTYNFDMSIREYRSLAEAQSDLAQSTPTIVFDKNRIDIMSLRSTLLTIPYQMPAPNANRKGHEGTLTSQRDGSSDLTLSYFLRDTSRTANNSAQATNLKIELIPPTLGNPLYAPTDWPRFLNSPVLDRLYRHFAPNELAPDSTYISVITATDDHAPEYREHKPASMLAKNGRYARESSQYDLEIWYDGLNPVSLTPAQRAAMQSYISGIFDRVTLDFVDDTTNDNINQFNPYSDGIQAHFHGGPFTGTVTTSGTSHSYSAGVFANELSATQQGSQLPSYQTIILNEPPSTAANVLAPGHVAGTFPYGVSTINSKGLANGHVQRPYLCALFFKSDVVGTLPGVLTDEDRRRPGYRPPIAGGSVIGSVSVQTYSNVVLHELLHASLGETSGGTHCVAGVQTCIRRNGITKWYNCDMSQLNSVTALDDNGDDYPTRSPFHDPAEIYAVLDNMYHEHKTQ